MFQPQSMGSGGLKLPPFPPRQLNQLTTNDPPVSYMTEEQVSQMKKYIFGQLDEFDASVLGLVQTINTDITQNSVHDSKTLRTVC